MHSSSEYFIVSLVDRRGSEAIYWCSLTPLPRCDSLVFTHKRGVHPQTIDRTLAELWVNISKLHPFHACLQATDCLWVNTWAPTLDFSTSSWVWQLEPLNT